VSYRTPRQRWLNPESAPYIHFSSLPHRKDLWHVAAITHVPTPMRSCAAWTRLEHILMTSAAGLYNPFITRLCIFFLSFLLQNLHDYIDIPYPCGQGVDEA
jgi:hypothetical protein